MARKATVLIEKDEHGFYGWCPELKGCQSQATTLEEAMANFKEAAELYFETLPADERDVLLSREILTTAVEVNAQAAALDRRRGGESAAGRGVRAPSLERKPRIYGTRVPGDHPFHLAVILHPKIVKQALEIIGEAAEPRAASDKS